MLRRRRPTKQLVKLHTVTDQTYEGILVDYGRDVVELANARVGKPGGEWSVLTGAVYIDRPKVLFMQSVVAVASA